MINNAHRLRIGWLAVVLAVAPATVQAQDSVALPAITVGPPIQRIATATAVSTEPLGSITSVRELPDGRLLLNDGTRRRLLLMDTTLNTVAVVLDSLSEIANTYGIRPGALIPFRGDTTLFVDPVSYAIVVLDAEARIVRVRSVWRVQDVPWFTNSSGAWGWPGVDASGRVVYRIPAQPARPRVRPPAGIPFIPQQPDSAFIVAVHLDTRQLDTLGAIRIPKTEMRVHRRVEGGFSFEQVINPLPSTDEWAVLPDGRVAFVRALDYRIDYLHPGGSWTSSAKLPYEWQRLSDEDKQRMADSVKVAQERSALMSFATAMIRWVNMYNQAYPKNFTVPEGFRPPMGFPRDWILPEGMNFPANYTYACAPGVEPAETPLAVAASGGATASGAPARPACLPAPVVVSGGVTPQPPRLRQISVMPPLELPDYRPPLPTGGAVRADADGNLWIRTIPPRRIPGGPVYDIVSPEGELVTRLQTPPGYSLVGFGKGKVVYLSMRDTSGIHLARVRLK